MEFVYCKGVKIYDTSKWGDLAVYGGRISGKRDKDLKVNPLYNDVSGVTSFSDINGNMSPVHIVTYESFPRTKRKTLISENRSLISENGKLQNGNTVRHNGVHYSLSADSGSLRNVNGNMNHGIELEAENGNLNGDDFSVPNLVHLKYNDSDLCDGDEDTEKKAVQDEHNEQNENDIDEQNTYAETEMLEKQHSRGFCKDYNLLGFSNQGFTLDEKDVISIPKPPDNVNAIPKQSDEIQSHSKLENEDAPADKIETVELQKSFVTQPDVHCELENKPNLDISTKSFVTKKQSNGDLPEATYEILDICDMQNFETDHFENLHDHSGNTQDEALNRGDSPLICHEEIVTEVLVHNSAILESPKSNSCADKSGETSACDTLDEEQIQVKILHSDLTDWPDINDLVRPSHDEMVEKSVIEIAQKDEFKTKTKGHIRSVSDIAIQEIIIESTDQKSDKSEVTDHKSELCDHEKSFGYKKKQKHIKSSSKSWEVSEAGSSTRTLKSILSNSSSYHSCSMEIEHTRQNSDSEIHELKTVKFSDDTIFNENKTNKYKKEKFGQINLRHLYKGRIMSDTAVAKMNPLFQSDEGKFEEDETDGEASSESSGYEVTLRNAMRLSKEKPTSLNGPSYLEQYLIFKAHGIKKDNIDIEKLPETMEQPVYDRLIERTLAKERRKFCVKWSMVILTVAVITAVATTLGVYFKEGL